MLAQRRLPFSSLLLLCLFSKYSTDKEGQSIVKEKEEERGEDGETSNYDRIQQ